MIQVVSQTRVLVSRAIAEGLGVRKGRDYVTPQRACAWMCSPRVPGYQGND